MARIFEFKKWREKCQQITLVRPYRLKQILKNVISGRSVGHRWIARYPPEGSFTKFVQCWNNFAGALNSDNPTDRPEMTFIKIYISLGGLIKYFL